jgi:hypothetical protein
LKALTINEVLSNSKEEFKMINKSNSSLHDYFDNIFLFLIKEFPAEDASEFLAEYEEEVIKFYKKEISVFDAAIKLRQSYEKFLHRYDTITS